MFIRKKCNLSDSLFETLDKRANPFSYLDAKKKNKSISEEKQIKSDSISLEEPKKIEPISPNSFVFTSRSDMFTKKLESLIGRPKD